MATVLAMWTAAFVIVVALLWRFFMDFWWRPRALGSTLRRQGLKGPVRKFMVGNMLELMKMRQSAKDNDMERLSHDILEHVMPDYYHWSKKYGNQYVHWWGTEPRITISDPEVIREILSRKAGQFGKSPIIQAGIVDALGYGLVTVNGDEWAHHRRVVAPAFYLEKLKGMIGGIASCTSELLDKWEIKIQEQPELEVSGDLSKLTAEVISHTAFGSSYLKGRRVFELLTAILDELPKLNRYNWLPGNRLLPLPSNFKTRRWKNELNSTLLRMISERVEHGRSNSYDSDLLGLMLAETRYSDKRCTAYNLQTLVDECKTFYIAGQETTATLLTWTMLMLAAYPDWQERARAEVKETCKAAAVPDAEMLSRFKVVGMILNETLRLYPPFIVFSRGAFEDTKVHELYIPKGAAVTIPILAIHHNTDLWGADANEFNPERFKDGILHACKHPNGFLPFSFGPRVCIGQSFALIEAKVALAMVLQRFSFQLSPSYRHNPATSNSLKPFHGLQLILKKL